MTDVTGQPWPAWQRIDPGRVPGGFWIRVTYGGRIAHEYGLDAIEFVAGLAESDAELASTLANIAGECRVFVYDGDTGMCIKTIIVGSK